MKTKLLILFSTMIGVYLMSCSKDKFTTKPQLEFKTVNSTVVGPGQQLIITLRYTDREGDIQDSLYVERRVLNNSGGCQKDSINLYYQIPPEVPEKSNAEGEILVRYSYAPDNAYEEIGEPGIDCHENDTCIYRFVLSDKAGNISDTASTPQIVIIKN